MINRKESLHGFKIKNFRDSIYNTEVFKFEKVLYRLVPQAIFKADNMLTKLFSNGLAVMSSKLTSMVEYVEFYFENNERRFNKK